MVGFSHCFVDLLLLLNGIDPILLPPQLGQKPFLVLLLRLHHLLGHFPRLVDLGHHLLLFHLQKRHSVLHKRPVGL